MASHRLKITHADPIFTEQLNKIYCFYVRHITEILLLLFFLAFNLQRML